MRRGLDRRTFIASASALALASRFAAAGKLSTRRVLLDPCNLIPLPRVRLKITASGDGTKYRFRTGDDGSWDIASLIDGISNSEGEEFRVRIRPRKIGGYNYAGLDHRMLLRPGIRSNAKAGHLSLIPLSGAGRALGITDKDFEAAWPGMLRDVLFSVENTPGEIPDGAARGAITRFARKKLTLRLGNSLSAAEADFVSDVVENNALEQLTAGWMRLKGTKELPVGEEPFFESDLPSGTLTVIKRDNYPKPVVRLRFSDADPYEIAAALIVLDDATLNSFFRGGAGGDEEIAYARHVVQRCLAAALGFRPTMRLPNRTLLDANFDPPGGIARTGIRPEDVLLARVLYGARCIVPGGRWSDGRTQIMRTNPRYPQGY